MHRQARSQRSSPPAKRALAGIGATLAIAFLIGFFLLAPERCASRRNAVVFDGVVEKKEISAQESRFGTRLSYILIVRDKSGELVRSGVPRAIYERARVGMPARKKAGEPWPTLGTE